MQDWLQSQQEWNRRALEAQAKAAHAFDRLLAIAQRDTGQSSRVRSFIAASFNGEAHAFDLFDLRAMDVEIADDVMACIDCLRWGRADLYRLVPNGLERVTSLLQEWRLGKAPLVDPLL